MYVQFVQRFFKHTLFNWIYSWTTVVKFICCLAGPYISRTASDCSFSKYINLKKMFYVDVSHPVELSERTY